MKFSFLLLLPLLLGVSTTPSTIGPAQVRAKPAAVPTCAALLEGGSFIQKGASGEGYTKVCYCISDGAASPAYQWCSMQFGVAAATITCAGGSTTVCP